MLQNKPEKEHPLAHISPYAMLHILVVIYGFTPILGRLISIGSLSLVWWRLVFSIVILYAYFRYRGFKIEKAGKTVILIFLTGFIIGIHWATFYESIKISNVNTAMCGFATMTFFTAFLEPLFFKRRISILEVLLGISTLVGLLIIAFNNEVKMEGIYYGIAAAFTAALFVNINVKFARQHHVYNITFYEFLGALCCVTVLSGLSESPSWGKLPGNSDIVWLLVLSVVCTVFPFIEATKIGRFISPFTMVLVNNLEPVYGIFLSFIFFHQSEVMNFQFYIGATIIIAGVLLYPYFKRQMAKA